MKQLQFRFPDSAALLPGEMIVDIFAGGGGASHGIEIALGRSPDVAINHDPAAIVMHTANHPSTEHFREDVWKVRIKEITRGRPVGLLWASPDCRHFSRAKGGKPVSKRVRSLASVVVKYAKLVRPRVICLENVPEFLTWGPLGPDDMPIKAREGEYYAQWARGLERLGYVVEKKILVASDYGAPTSRKRIFVVARRDGLPIVWPAPTHGPGRSLPYRTAAECIDWAIPCPSIFDRKKSLAEATLRRIARGIVRYVLEDKKPFIISVAHGYSGGRREYGLGETLGTLTKENQFAVCTAFLAKHYGGVVGQAMEKPLGTVTQIDHHSLVTAHLSQRYGLKGGEVRARRADEPLATVTARDHNELAAVHLTKFYGTGTGSDVRNPMPTVTAGGEKGGNTHLGIVAAHLTHYYGEKAGETRGRRPDEPLATQSTENRFGLVSAFLLKYYGTAVGQKPDAALDTITAKARFGVVTVTIDGQEYAIADIGMRMLQPHELAAAQGFPPDYVLTGTKSEQVAKIGNSVCPPVAAALVRANLTEADARMEAIA